MQKKTIFIRPVTKDNAGNPIYVTKGGLYITKIDGYWYTFEDNDYEKECDFDVDMTDIEIVILEDYTDDHEN